MATRPIALLLALALVAAGASPAIAALCGNPQGAMARSCCSEREDCGMLAALPEMTCCEAAPVQAPSGSQQGAGTVSWLSSLAALPASALVPAAAVPPGGGANDAPLASLAESLPTYCSPLRL
jgi:hypothetical protein